MLARFALITSSPELSLLSNVPAIHLDAVVLTTSQLQCVQLQLHPHALAITPYSASLLCDLKQDNDVSPQYSNSFLFAPV